MLLSKAARSTATDWAVVAAASTRAVAYLADHEHFLSMYAATASAYSAVIVLLSYRHRAQGTFDPALHLQSRNEQKAGIPLQPICGAAGGKGRLSLRHLTCAANISLAAIASPLRAVRKRSHSAALSAAILQMCSLTRMSGAWLLAVPFARARCTPRASEER